MNPDDAYKALEQLNAANELRQTIGDAVLYFSILLVLFLFRNIIEDWAKCILWKWVTGRDYKQDDIVIFDGQYGRIVRVGLFRTMFYIYHLDQPKDKVQVQTKRLVFNSEMKEHALEKPLDMFNVPKFIRQIVENKQ